MYPPLQHALADFTRVGVDSQPFVHDRETSSGETRTDKKKHLVLQTHEASVSYPIRRTALEKILRTCRNTDGLRFGVFSRFFIDVPVHVSGNSMI